MINAFDFFLIFGGRQNNATLVERLSTAEEPLASTYHQGNMQIGSVFRAIFFYFYVSVSCILFILVSWYKKSFNAFFWLIHYLFKNKNKQPLP